MSFLSKVLNLGFNNTFQTPNNWMNGINSIGSKPGVADVLNQFNGSYQQKDANDMALMAWNMANDYNHPIQQMERLAAAGLNPNLVYGSGSVTGNTAGTPALTGGGVSTTGETMFKGLNNVMSLMQGQATLQQTNAQTKLAGAQATTSGAQASYLGEQAANMREQTKINKIRSTYERKSQIADLEYKQALADKTRAEASLVQGEADIFGSTGGTKGAKAIGEGVGALGKTARFVRGIFK